ncbi:T9SS type A sorting domain-containing protein [Epilithonimonas arachidiradicis]|uniref:Putative secreted protein (Por secretion system target) n=1 Tax=Epilithonimonas arachidiradicis TaxID=1617282 RepID=A0A420DCW2_9FLAO|nr:T9SS type A sorting domain-containing protein [Epilithonimonas arachidiradicis]RKE89721.1 putative secreted protein (Por secretion system target) [Epilithonimonas arachidiradicis]GGG44748.1 hypothetical protein GCM10007332_02810 [Epilithonimonas arachidiradicis]
MKKIFIFNFLLTLNLVYSQSWTWGIKATGTSQNYNAIDLKVDGDGNMILAGYYRLNFSLGNFSISSPDDYYRDIYLAKINSNKEVLWLKSIDGGGSYGDKITVESDDNGNYYLSGQIDSKIFIAKYDSNGNELWLNNFNNENYGYGTAISFDEQENIYLAGGRGDTFFLAKLNPNGETVWKKSNRYNYSDAISISDIDVDRFGNIYLIGIFAADTITIDRFTLTNDAGGYDDMFWSKIDTDGNFLWIKSSTGRTYRSPKISLTHSNEIVISGTYRETLKLDNVVINSYKCCGYSTPFIAKLDSNNNPVWIKNGSRYSFNYDFSSNYVDMKTDFSGNVYLTGSYYDNGYNVFFEKFDNNGDFKFRNDIRNDSGYFSHALDIDNLGNLYYAGYNYRENFINYNVYSPPLSAGIGQFNTNAPTFNKIKKPIVNGNKLLCTNDNSLNFSAIGENIKWYSDSQLTNLLGSGNSFNLNYINDTKIFVTQTINNIESWPRVVDVKKSDLNINNINLQYNSPRLSVINNSEYSYQWYYNNVLITNANTYYIDVENENNYLDYSVVISQSNCSVTVDTNILGLNENKIENYTIYPNPVIDNFSLNIPNNTDIISIDVIDSSGKLVKSFDKNSKYNISNIPTGKYYVLVKTKAGNNIISIIKK